MNVEHPFMTQAEVTRITRASVDWIQTWVNRGHVKLAVQNPGRGKRRLYAACDAVRLAIMARFAAFGVDVDKAANIANVAAETVIRGGRISWDDHLSLSFHELLAGGRWGVVHADGRQSLTTLGAFIGDLNEMPVSTHAEWFRGTGQPRRRDDGERIIPRKREEVALEGIHAEPFLFFPIGEVVNGVLVQCKELWLREMGE